MLCVCAPSLTCPHLCAPLQQTTQAWTSVRSPTWWTRASRSTRTVLWSPLTTATSWSAASGTRASVFTPLKLVGSPSWRPKWFCVLLQVFVWVLLTQRSFSLFASGARWPLCPLRRKAHPDRVWPLGRRDVSGQVGVLHRRRLLHRVRLQRRHSSSVVLEWKTPYYRGQP